MSDFRVGEYKLASARNFRADLKLIWLLNGLNEKWNLGIPNQTIGLDTLDHSSLSRSKPNNPFATTI